MAPSVPAGAEKGVEGGVHFDVSIDEHAEEYSVLAVRGEVDLHTAPKVQYAIERAAGNGADAVVVDMSGVEFMDSTALSLCNDNGLPIYVFNMDDAANIERIVSGERVGTLVRS